MKTIDDAVEFGRKQGHEVLSHKGKKFVLLPIGEIDGKEYGLAVPEKDGPMTYLKRSSSIKFSNSPINCYHHSAISKVLDTGKKRYLADIDRQKALKGNTGLVIAYAYREQGGLRPSLMEHVYTDLQDLLSKEEMTNIFTGKLTALGEQVEELNGLSGLPKVKAVKDRLILEFADWLNFCHNDDIQAAYYNCSEKEFYGTVVYALSLLNVDTLCDLIDRICLHRSAEGIDVLRGACKTQMLRRYTARKIKENNFTEAEDIVGNVGNLMDNAVELGKKYGYKVYTNGLKSYVLLPIGKAKDKTFGLAVPEFNHIRAYVENGNGQIKISVHEVLNSVIINKNTIDNRGVVRKYLSLSKKGRGLENIANIYDDSYKDMAWDYLFSDKENIYSMLSEILEKRETGKIIGNELNLLENRLQGIAKTKSKDIIHLVRAYFEFVRGENKNIPIEMDIYPKTIIDKLSKQMFSSFFKHVKLGYDDCVEGLANIICSNGFEEGKELLSKMSKKEFDAEVVAEEICRYRFVSAMDILEKLSKNRKRKDDVARAIIRTGFKEGKEMLDRITRKIFSDYLDNNCNWKMTSFENRGRYDGRVNYVCTDCGKRETVYYN